MLKHIVLGLALSWLAACDSPSPTDSEQLKHARQQRLLERALQHSNERSQITVEPVRLTGTRAATSIQFKIKNGNNFSLLNPVVHCGAKSETGTYLEEYDKTIYRAIPAHGSITTKSLFIGSFDEQSETISCEIATWETATI